jgi:hypothetical protein
MIFDCRLSYVMFLYFMWAKIVNFVSSTFYSLLFILVCQLSAYFICIQTNPNPILQFSQSRYECHAIGCFPLLSLIMNTKTVANTLKVAT